MGELRRSEGEIESWEVLVQHLPSAWRELARETGAVRRLRGFRDVDSVLRLLLLHVATGTSLRDSTVYAREAGWANVSDVTALDRLRGFRDVDSVLRLLLLHVATGTSLRDSTVYAREAGWANVSDVTALDRL